MKRMRGLLLLCVLMVIIPFSSFLGMNRSTAGEPLPSTEGTQTDGSDTTKSNEKENEETDIARTTDPNQQISVYLHQEDRVEQIPLAQYLKGVVMAEMPATFHPEALKAQAVIAHTYMLRVMANEQKNPSKALKGASISSDPGKHQAYLSEEALKGKYGGNYDEYYEKISACVDEVVAEVLTYEDQPIVAAFHAISAGKTEAAKNVWGTEVPYLVKTESTGDLEAPSFENSTKFSADEVKKVLGKAYPDLKFSDKPSDWFGKPAYTASGYVASIEVLGENLEGVEVRKLFDLKSANFTVSVKENQFIFTTKGYGHGVGMSQYGADYMARNGSSYQEILAHYYPKTTLVKI